VSTALGDLEGIRVFVEGDVWAITTREEFDIAYGLASENINFIFYAFLTGKW